MENIAFATFLFLVYLGFGFWLFCCPTVGSANEMQVMSPPTLADYREAFEVEPELEEETPHLSPSSEAAPLSELLEGIDLDRLHLRPARKIASKLGIAQKVNGKDQPLQWLRAQIKKRVLEKPEETIPVIKEVLIA